MPFDLPSWDSPDSGFLTTPKLTCTCLLEIDVDIFEVWIPQLIRQFLPSVDFAATFSSDF